MGKGLCCIISTFTSGLGCLSCSRPPFPHLLTAFLLYTTAIRILLCLRSTRLNKDSRDRLSAGDHGVGSMHRAGDGAEQIHGELLEIISGSAANTAHEKVIQKVIWKPLKSICSSTASSHTCRIVPGLCSQFIFHRPES